MFRYIKKHYLLALSALFISILVQIASPASAVLEQKLIDFIVQGNLDGFQKMLLYVALLVVTIGAACYFKALAENKLKAKFMENLRDDLYYGIMQKKPAAFQEQDTAEYLSIINNDVNTLGMNFTSPICTLTGIGFSSILSLTIIFLYSPLLAAAAILCSFLSFLVPTILTKRLQKRLIEKVRYEAAMDVQVKEALNGHEVISAYGVLPQMCIRFSEANKHTADSSYKLASVVSGLENSSLVIGTFVRFLTFLIAGSMAINEQISIGTVILFVSLYASFSSGILALSQCIPLLRSCRPIIDKLMAIADGMDCTFIGNATPSFSREIRVEDLSFQYKEGLPVLTGFDLAIHKKDKLALVGASGCGKSTFIRLLSGDYSNYQGGIYYDDAELRQLDIGELRKTVTVIHQHTHIFNDTIRYNICLGEDFAEEAFDRALRLSGVDKFLPCIEGGVDGACGENGANLSGGQKQRIALARALVRGIDFLILDEGVSAIDVETANEIEQELLDMENLTLLTITHRIKDGLLQCYDKVFSMAGGKIAEQIL